MRNREGKERVRKKQKGTEQAEKRAGTFDPAISVCSALFRFFRTLSSSSSQQETPQARGDTDRERKE
jgi:hypothetical protein